MLSWNPLFSTMCYSALRLFQISRSRHTDHSRTYFITPPSTTSTRFASLFSYLSDCLSSNSIEHSSILRSANSSNIDFRLLRIQIFSLLGLRPVTSTNVPYPLPLYTEIKYNAIHHYTHRYYQVYNQCAKQILNFVCIRPLPQRPL